MPLDPPALAGLDALQRDVLLILALEGEHPMSRTRLNERASEAGLVDDRNRKLVSATFKPIVGALAACGATVEVRQEYVCARSWTLPVVEDAERRGRLVPIARALRAASRSTNDSMRAAMLAGLAAGDAERIQASERFFERERQSRSWSGPRSEVDVLGLDVYPHWLARMSASTRVEYLRVAVNLAFERALALGAAVEAAALACEDEAVRAQTAMLLALRGEAARANEILATNGASQWTRGARGFVALTEGRLAEARALFVIAATGVRGQRVDPPGVIAVFDALLAATSDVADEVADVERRLKKGQRFFAHYGAAQGAIEQLASFRRIGSAHVHRYAARTWIDAFFNALAQTWMGEALGAPSKIETWEPIARASGYTWLADEIVRIQDNDRAGSLLALFGTKEAWQLSLDTLRIAIDGGSEGTSAKGKPGAELWWTLTLATDGRLTELDAFLVVNPKAKGTKVSTRRLVDPTEGIGSEQDRRVAAELERGPTTYHSLDLSTLVPLAGHPRIRDENGKHLTVEVREPLLRLDATKKGAVLRLVPSRFDVTGFAVVREGTTLVVYRQTALAARIIASIPREGLAVPRAGLGLLSEVLGGGTKGIAVETASAVAAESVPGDPRPHVQLFRAGGALRARLRVVPGGASGPALRPGTPPAETMASGKDGLVRIVRDLAEESARADRLLARCPVLASLPQDGNDGVTRDLATSLELLVELHDAGDDAIVEWPEGQPMRAPIVRSVDHVKFRVKGSGAWLSVEGEVQIDESRVIAMRELVENASRGHGRFVPVGEDAYIALTDSLRKKLAALARVQRLSKDGRIPGALLSGMEGIWEGVETSFTDAVEKRRAALDSARDLQVKTPRALEAELRDYQREGFLFLVRRTEAGLGAVLADDMGLGKTVQAIALMLHRRKAGPSLVVAPTSVRRNWENELRRFAPSLAITRFGDGDRAEQVAAARAGDVVLVSYGLLAAAPDVLASRAWGTIVLDEAHALKNATTQRWSAARGLKGYAIVALTGTPVENHAGELHALFDLLLPGMLGVRATFDRALGAPIADGDREAAALLRQIIRPFVLRRTKSEVLSELPPKTELVHMVPASPEHLAYYEAIRRRALEKIEAARNAGGADAARARIDILAEITRLRRAAIDPRLVGGDEAPPGGKIDALLELVTELKTEGRRALVFSQFLEVLDLARARLEGAGIECLRLDGSMSEASRAAEVAAFQSGRGDVFLVSLKAGGVGMNLTAADFVVFLDPWWNPAVEDQAVGRAHRMGQERPVTVARIVTERTIEEKVLALHAKKRALYEDLVSDADGSGTLSVEAIGELLGA